MKIYFLHTGLLSFVRKDLEIFLTAHEVREENNYRKIVSNIVKNVRGILWADLVFCWFASIHFLPAVLLTNLFGRKLVVLVGGYDVADLPEINYGSMRGGLRKSAAKFILRVADRVICISNSNRQETAENAGVDPAKIAMIYHGFHASGGLLREKEKMVVTVGAVTWDNLKRKGLEDFVRVASYFRDVPFKLVGKWMDDSYKVLMQIATPNVEVMGYLDNELMKSILERAKVYVQASCHEGFGCAVAEAMLYRCIPVVNNVFALPEVVGDCGFLSKPGDIEDLRAKIELAFSADNSVGERSREHILNKFPLDKRAETLLQVISDV